MNTEIIKAYKVKEVSCQNFLKNNFEKYNAVQLAICEAAKNGHCSVKVDIDTDFYETIKNILEENGFFVYLYSQVANSYSFEIRW